jgi:hypothetical protein
MTERWRPLLAERIGWIAAADVGSCAASVATRPMLLGQLS